MRIVDMLVRNACARRSEAEDLNAIHISMNILLQKVRKKEAGRTTPDAIISFTLR